MRKSVLLLILTGTSLLTFSQRKNANDFGVSDFYTFILGPQLGGMALLIGSDDQTGEFNFEYNIGAFFNLRPLRPVGFEIDINYHKIINYDDYYSVPVLIGFYSKKNRAFIIGPSFIYEADKNKIDLKNPDVGISVGWGSQLTNVLFTFYEDHPLFNSDGKTQFFFGVGFKFRMGFSLSNY